MSDMALEGSADRLTETTASALVAIGTRIRELRQVRGMTLQALAGACDLSSSMLSLVERGRASPSIGSLVVIASALGVTMSDLITAEAGSDERLVVRSADQQAVETADHVIRRLLRDDRSRGVSIAINEYEPHTGNAIKPVAHEGYEYGYVLEGCLTVEVDGTAHQLQAGDLISYQSKRSHRFWNHSEGRVRTLWFNLRRD